MDRIRHLFLLCLLLSWPPLAAAGVAVPPALEGWQGWVLYGHEDARCPTDSRQRRLCAWPERLELEVGERGARFRQAWELLAEGFVPLPGGPGLWPREVRVDGRPHPVVADAQGRPRVHLERGRHLIEGRLVWRQRPHRLPLPAEVALIALSMNGRSVAMPRRERDGSLLLAPRPRPTASTNASTQPPDTLEVRVWRLLRDQIPQRLELRLSLSVSGRPREIVLMPPMPDGLTPYHLSGSVPVRLERDGRLRLQVRPGRATIRLVARADAPLNTIAVPATTDPNWPARELWAFETGAHREAELRGGVRVDPAQTDLPSSWLQYPALRVTPGRTRLELVELRRLDPLSQPDHLTLQRDLWLDFDGNGWTLRDRLEGELRRSSRLTTIAPLQLASATLAGQPQPVTRLPDDTRPGIELRRKRIDLEALARIEDGLHRLPANGWSVVIDRAETRLHLPPGWRLLGAQGTEPVAGSWIQRWTLLDLFLVLVVAIASLKLFGPLWGGLALAALALTWHEPDAPHYTWINLLAAAALVHALPQGRLRRVLRLWQWGALGLLLLTLIPFAVQEVRTALFPQLETPALRTDAPSASPADTQAARLERKAAQPSAAPVSGGFADIAGLPSMQAPPEPAPATPAPRETSPELVAQSGPAVPDWRARTYLLRWNGPVTPDQSLRLWLIPPEATRLLKLLAVLAALALAARLGGLPLRRPPRTAGGLLPFLLLASAPGLAPPPALADIVLPPDQGAVAARELQDHGIVPPATQWPERHLLDELRRRLLAPPPCHPHCLAIPQGELRLAGQRLVLDLEVHADADTLLPLPRFAEPVGLRELRIDGRPAALRREQDGLLAAIPRGRHRVRLTALLPAALERLSLEFPEPLHALELSLPEPWQAHGRQPNRAVRALELRRPPRQRADDDANEAPLPASALEPVPLPALLRVERIISLGHEWRVKTIIRREDDALGAVRLEIPLLENEVPLGEVPIRDGRLQVFLSAGRKSTIVHSRLPADRGSLTLQAPQSLPHGADGWYEVWVVIAAPFWHLRHEGLPLADLEPDGGWELIWRPWPGEEVRLDVIRPEALPGPTLTLQRLSLNTRPGERRTRHELEAVLRSTRGEIWRPRLPDDARLQSLVVDGRERPADDATTRLEIPLSPGEHQVTLRWDRPGGTTLLTRTGAFDIGLPGANLELSLALGHERWVLLTGGPAMGPAVLFWGILLVIVLLAWALARSRLTPLGLPSWLLLGIGLSQVPVAIGLAVAGWLLLLGLRQRRQPQDPGLHNAMQLGLALYTLVALVLLFVAVHQGLLGHPEMQIAGLGSGAGLLHWYADRSGETLPRGWALSLPLWVYRLLMLAWALWLAFALIGWLRWGWAAMQEGGLWRRMTLRKRQSPPPEGQ